MRHDSTTAPRFQLARRALPKLTLPALLAAALAFVAAPAVPAAAQPASPDAGVGTTSNTSAIGIASPQPLAERAAASYRAAARYPEHSRAIARGAADPVRARRTPNPHSLRAEGEGSPEITVWASEVSYEHSAVVMLYASVDDATSGKAKKRDSASVRGEVVTQDGAEVGTVDYRDDGEGADRRAGDGIHTAAFKVPEEHVPALAASFGVKVTAVTGEGDVVGVLGGFLYGQPHARLTGRYRDSVRDGSLVVEAEVEVEKAGRFYLEGTLASVAGGKAGKGAAGEPVGWAQAAAELHPGVHWLELEFYGLMFQERGAAGPYRLASVGLATTSGMPNALNDLVEDAHRTAAYPLARFTTRGYANPGLLHAAERLEAATQLEATGQPGPGK